MDKLLYVLPALACPIGMGLMMVAMMKPGKGRNQNGQSAVAADAELAELREQIADLREQARVRSAVGHGETR